MTTLTQPRLWLAATTIFVIFAGVFFASSAPFSIPEVQAACGLQPPDMRFFTAADDVTNFLDQCGPAGRDSYRNMLLADLFYPAVVGLFLASSLAITLSRLRGRESEVVGLAALPLVASGFDYIENMFAWFALARYPSPAPTDVLLGYASAAKTITSWASGILLLGCLALLGAGAIRRKLRPTSDAAREPRLAGRRPVSA